MKKLKAFTLLEVIVAMVITAVVVSVAITAFLIIQRQFDAYRERGGKIFQVQQARSYFAKDLADAVTAKSAGAILHLTMPNGQTISYHFRAGVLTRETGLREDTIATGIALPDFGYVTTKSNTSLVNRIGFTMTVDERVYPLSFYKQYSAADLINLEE